MYRPLSCVQTGAQDGPPRFPVHDRPLIKHWRCDLTALSHAYNLYFVACNDEIYVYEPSFPHQGLGEPAKILVVPVSGLPVPPGIDISDPHSITRLHVDYLGNTEVLLATCDDGDVVGYRVPEIHRAIVSQRDSLDGDDESDTANEVRCFEHHNVGCSAWGLAVHRNARLIAISANTHLVRVVAYGLSQPDDSSDCKNDLPFPRNQNRFITLRAQTNIPAVSFDNTGADPTGRWLSCSTIDGLTHLWDLSKPNQPARIIAVGYCASVSNQPDTRALPGYSIEGPTVPGSCKCLNRNSVPHAAWAALFIDPWSCHYVESLAEACGSGSSRSVGSPSRKPRFIDITDTKVRPATRSSVPGDWLPSLSVTTISAEESEGENEGTNSEGSDQMSINSPSDDVDLHIDPTETNAQTITVIPAIDWSQQSSSAFLMAFADEHEEFLGVTPPLPSSSPNEESLFTTPPLPPSLPNEEAQSDEEEDSSSSGNEMLQQGFDRLKKPYCTFITSNYHHEQSDESLINHPRPLIIVTKEEIYLFQRPLDPKTPSAFPVLTMRNPLYPEFPVVTTPKNMYHRQCFTAQIPELGVFIVASPAGRAGIFRLTRTPYESEHCTEMFGFRLDHLLPVLRQGEDGDDEEDSDVWVRQLVGVAVGPVQGMFDANEEEGKEVTREEGARRWRLMMYYNDHTVYSYELGKYAGEEEVGMEELIV